METNHSLKSKENKNSLIISYLTLRKTIGWLGISLPFILLGGNLFITVLENPEQWTGAIQSSISNYYYTRMGVVFAGIMCAVALFLFSYVGETKADSWLSNLAGSFALGIVLFPTTPKQEICGHWYGPTGNLNVEVFHIIFAALFFLTLASISYFIFTKSETKRRSMFTPARNLIYKTCGLIMFICLILMAVVVVTPSGSMGSLNKIKPVYLLETLALIAFGISWLVKGEYLYNEKSHNQNHGLNGAC